MSEKVNTFDFLKEYRKYPCLWLKQSPDFRHRRKRDEAEAALMQIFDLGSITLLRQKIRSIRGTYNQERAKVRRSLTIPGDSGMIYKPKLVWYNFAENFLKLNEGENDSLSNADPNEEDNPEINFSLKPEDTQISFPDTVMNPQMYNFPESTHSPRDSPPCKRKCLPIDHHRDKLNDLLSCILKVVKQLAHKPTSNEFSIFGQHVATQLQALPLKESLQVQNDIQGIITTARIKHLSEYGISSVSTSTSNDTSSTTVENSDIQLCLSLVEQLVKVCTYNVYDSQ